MKETIRSRLKELEKKAGQEPSTVYLQQPYLSDGRRFIRFTESAFWSPDIPIQDRPFDLITRLLENSMNGAGKCGFFFLDPAILSSSGSQSHHQTQPSIALLNVSHLWGSILYPKTLDAGYMEDGFLRLVLRNLSGDLEAASLDPTLVVQTIQTEVLLSYYYLYAACPVEGRYHCAIAVSLALGAGLNTLGPALHQRRKVYPPFSLATPDILPLAGNSVEETYRVKAFWAVLVLNNYWVAAYGFPSAMPTGIPIDTPWPSSAGGGATISTFLNGCDLHGFSPTGLVAKASALLEQVIAFSVSTADTPDPRTLDSFASISTRSRASLPPLSGDPPLVIAHVLTDVAILRSHSPYLGTSSAMRDTVLLAAGRVVENLEMANLHESVIDPILAPGKSDVDYDPPRAHKSDYP
ncbi:hypothetical protein DFH07DRAFT_951559 [Mycena maculata]|uniref:Transcription factor domain-containing protein n=1 Tax=Mycena maculata TaxID=230809 RepID=A0AAD7K2E9_9AGAR|nr:hypothetical protein DFH07DRAFT_951559 [Mycena maculata]